MPDIVVTSIDFAAGLKPRNLVVPPTTVEVVLKNPAPDLQKAVKDDKLIVQKIAAAAFDVLKKAKDEFQAAIEDLDQTYTKKLPEDQREADERTATLNAVCKRIAQAQSDAASAAAQKEWDNQVRKNKDLTKFKVVFALKLTLGTIALAASIAAAVLSVGTLAITILGAAKTLAGAAADIYNFCRDMEKTEKDIIDTDAALAKSWTDKDLTAGKIAKELAAALGAPFLKSVIGMDKLLGEYSAKNAKKDYMADDLWAKAKKLMANIQTAPAKISAAQKQVLDKLGTAVGKLLDQIGELVGLSRSNDLFWSVYRARCDTYKALEGGALGKTADATGVALVLAGIASTANTVVSIAMTLA